MIEDINAQAHQLLDTLTFAGGNVALSVLRTLSQNRLGTGSFASLLGMEIIEADGGSAVTRLEIQPHMLNSLGIMHGGIAFSLADVTTGVAAATLLEKNQSVVTQDLHYRYHGMVRHGAIEARGTVLHKGSRTVVVQCLLTQDGRLIGSADGTFALMTAQDLAST